MLRERTSSQSEVIGAIVSGYNPCCGVPPLFFGGRDPAAVDTPVCSAHIACHELRAADAYLHSAEEQEVRQGRAARGKQRRGWESRCFSRKAKGAVLSARKGSGKTRQRQCLSL